MVIILKRSRTNPAKNELGGVLRSLGVCYTESEGIRDLLNVLVFHGCYMASGSYEGFVLEKANGNLVTNADY